MAQLWPLFKIQQLDLQIRDLLRERKELDSGESISAEIKLLEAERAAAMESVRENQKQQKKIDLELGTITRQRTENENKLYGGMSSNMKELSGWQKDIEQLTARQGKVEEQLLALMEKAEELERVAAQKDQLVQERTKALRVIEEATHKETVRIDQELEGLTTRRKKMASEIEPTLFKRYEALRKQKGGLAVVRLQKDSCGGCHMNLPSSTLEKVMSRQLTTCGHCGRILLVDGG